MKKLMRKTWFQVVVFGGLLGLILILTDNWTGIFNPDSKKSGVYEGPVTMDKKDVYVTSIRFNETSFDFGKINEGDTVNHIFNFKNTGKDPLFIFKIAGSCDCIGTALGKDVVAPGVEESMTVYFDTKGRKGPQKRTVVVTANTEPSETVLTLTADIQ